MNHHDPPSDREVKNVYSATITKLRAENDSLKTQRAELLDDTERLIEAVYTYGPDRENKVIQAKRMCQIIREEMETE